MKYVRTDDWIAAAGPRPQRLRRTEGLRRLRRETELRPAHLVAPLFVAERPEDAAPIRALPGVRRHAPAELPDVVGALAELGVGAVLLFGVPARKDPRGDAALDADGIVPRAVRSIRAAHPEMTIVTDVCLCGYTDHGHCGVVRDGHLDGHLDDHLDQGPTLDALGRMAVVHAQAGADLVAPSAMVDGMVAAVRGALDVAGHDATGILSYSVKYASALYGPFREAAASAPSFGDRRAHQMDPANRREAWLEADLDVREGADVLMVKPAGAYLDVIRELRDRWPEVPLAAYQVSGEYAMIRAAAAEGWIDERGVILETLTAIRRAGADLVITYFASSAAAWLGGRP